MHTLVIQAARLRPGGRGALTVSADSAGAGSRPSATTSSPSHLHAVRSIYHVAAQRLARYRKVNLAWAIRLGYGLGKAYERRWSAGFLRSGRNAAFDEHSLWTGTSSCFQVTVAQADQVWTLQITDRFVTFDSEGRSTLRDRTDKEVVYFLYLAVATFVGTYLYVAIWASQSRYEQETSYAADSCCLPSVRCRLTLERRLLLGCEQPTCARCFSRCVCSHLLRYAKCLY